MIFDRLELNYGKENVNILKKSTVAIIGIGGVGSYCCEALARSAVGRLVIIDKDVVDITNINRQLIALNSTVGEDKVQVMKNRIFDINPKCEVIAIKEFYDKKMTDCLLAYKPDFVVDACDIVTSKYDIIEMCLKNDIMFISAMGAANKVKPELFKISTLNKTSYDPLAKVLRKKTKDNRLKGIIPVVYSEEQPMKSVKTNEAGLTRKEIFVPASNSFTPSVSGLLCASFVVNSLVNNKYVF